MHADKLSKNLPDDRFSLFHYAVVMPTFCIMHALIVRFRPV